jgi:hypothetical protein
VEEPTDTETVEYEIDYERVAADIRSLSPRGAVPFLAGIMIAGLMIMPTQLQPAIFNIKKHNMNLDNFEVLCVFFGRNDKLRTEFLEQTADYASNGVFPEGPDQEGWNAGEFEQAIKLLELTLNS